jgi:Polyketide cyclase / dehydrase and lipid transport
MGTLMKSGRVEALTAATPEQVWSVLADVTRIGEWSHECRSMSWLGDVTAADVGARYTGANRVGRTRWSRQNEIITADAPRELAWRTVPSPIYRDSTEWRIRLEPLDGGTRIVQTFEVLELNAVFERLIYALMKPHRDRLRALAADMQRLGQLALSEPTARGGPTEVTAVPS